MKRKLSGKTHKYILIASALLIGLMLKPAVSEAKGTYTVKTSTAPCNKVYKNAATYNKKTKHYYMLKSYLEKLEADGGGTLTLKKGTYNIPCTLNVPSNVTIKLKKGVILKKTTKTGTKKLKASNSMFELVAPSIASSNKKTVKKYKGSVNVTITGSAGAAINMSNAAGSTAIVCGHNKNTTISGINFKNMNGGAFIVVGSSNKVTVSDCSFQGSKTAASNANRYAISLETADAKTKILPYKWSKADLTPNKNITIKNNKFTKLTSAIGSVKYTENVFHTNVKITDNSFSGLTGNAIRILNWTSPVIENNTFSNITNDANSIAAILASGVTTPSITGNSFDTVSITVKFAPAVNKGAGKTYPTIYNTINDTTTSLILSNTVSNLGVYYIPKQNTLAENSISRLGYFMDYSTKDYVINPNQIPYRDHYTDDTWYNNYTRDYYVFKSYLEQLERVGGGTLTVNAGTYSITNTLFIPSNTKIIFKDGCVINKGTYTGFPDTVLVPSQSVFQLLEPSLALGKEVVGGYDGAHDVQLIGEGTVIVDMLFYYGATAVILAHNNNVTIQNINFRNYLGHHMIELNSSQNVTIDNCSFVGSKSTNSKDSIKEAINIDTPDANTGGLNLAWPKQDRTPVNNVTIQNSSFNNTLRAIGSHKYSVSLLDNMTQLYHTNVNILNNMITNTQGWAIRSINWKNCVIKGNTFMNVYENGNPATTDVAIRMSGAVNPTITGNTFNNVRRPIILNSTDSKDSTTADKTYPRTDTFFDPVEKTDEYINAMLDNTLIDVEKPSILYYIEGNTKANSKAMKTYKYDSSKVSYTKPTPTPGPSTTPDPEEEESSPQPSATPSAAPSPTPSAAPAM